MERYYTYRMAKDYPAFIERNEELYMAFAPLRNADTNEYDFVATMDRLRAEFPEEPLEKLAAELNTTTDTIAHSLRHTQINAAIPLFSYGRNP